MTVHVASLYFETKSQKILDNKFNIGMAKQPLYILYSDNNNNKAVPPPPPIIRAENFFLECYDGLEEIRDLILHNNNNNNNTHPDIVLNATCTLNECNQKINIYHVSSFGKDVTTAWYGEMALSQLPEVYKHTDDHALYWWRNTPVNSVQQSFKELLLRLDGGSLLTDGSLLYML
jgi:hypothetical protein